LIRASWKVGIALDSVTIPLDRAIVFASKKVKTAQRHVDYRSKRVQLNA
jgi:hypothetical protein